MVRSNPTAWIHSAVHNRYAGDFTVKALATRIHSSLNVAQAVIDQAITQQEIYPNITESVPNAFIKLPLVHS